MSKDLVFKNPKGKIKDFEFDKTVVNVFDDMVARSVPFYNEIQRMIAELAEQFALPHTTVYDLGCSTGTTMINLDTRLEDSIEFVGIDNSDEMLYRCKANLAKAGVTRNVQLLNRDISQNIQLENVSVVTFGLTLQFIRPINRQKILENISRQLPENGVIILIEKIITETPRLNRPFIDFYYKFKERNGYDEIEIAKKREALENVLIPFKESENKELLLTSGFKDVETFFKWYNFTGMIAIK